MNAARILIVFVMMMAICGLLIAPVVYSGIVGDPVLIGLSITFLVIGIAVVMKESLRSLKPGKMLLVWLLGRLVLVYTAKVVGMGGIADSGIAAKPPFITHDQLLPTGAIMIAIRSNTAFTQNDADDPEAEVVVYAHIQATLKPGLRLGELVQLMPGAEDIPDLTQLDSDKQVTYRANAKTLLVEEVPEKCMVIARLLRTLLEDPFNEGTAQAIRQFPLRAALGDKAKIQKIIVECMYVEGTIWHDHKLRECFTEFDVTVIQISPTSEEVRKAVQSRGVALRQGQAQVITAEANTRALQVLAAALKTPGVKEALAAQVLADTENLSVIGGGNLLGVAQEVLGLGKGTSADPKGSETDKK